MLVIRLARTGRKKYATYRLVVADSRRAATGKFVSLLGHYNPHTKELVLNKPDVEKFIKDGAQPSDAVVRLLQREKVALPSWIKYEEKKKSPKAKAKERAKAATAAQAEPAAAEPEPVEAVTNVAETQVEIAEEQAPATAKSVSAVETAAEDEKQVEAATEGEEQAAAAAQTVADVSGGPVAEITEPAAEAEAEAETETEAPSENADATPEESVDKA